MAGQESSRAHKFWFWLEQRATPMRLAAARRRAIEQCVAVTGLAACVGQQRTAQVCIIEVRTGDLRGFETGAGPRPFAQIGAFKAGPGKITAWAMRAAQDSAFELGVGQATVG